MIPRKKKCHLGDGESNPPTNFVISEENSHLGDGESSPPINFMAFHHDSVFQKVQSGCEGNVDLPPFSLNINLANGLVQLLS